MTRWLSLLLFLTACGSDDDMASGGTGGTSGTGGASGGSSGTATMTDGPAFGDTHSGNFWLGPVDYTETQYHNACAPSVKYPAGIRALYGTYIMGLANEVVVQGLKASAGQLCDACVELDANGATVIAHAVTYGQETGPNDIDVSPEAYASLMEGDASHSGTWQLVACPTTEPIQYTFDGREWSNVYFFRVWPRNARLPVTKLEYQLGAGSWSAAELQSDGAWQASGSDFSGGFSVRLTALDGQTLEDRLPGLNTFDPDVGISSSANFE